MQHFFFPLTFAFLHIVLPELLTWRLNGKNLNVKLLSGSDRWPGRLHTSAKLSLFKAFVRLFIKRVKAQSRSSDSDAGSPQMSVFFLTEAALHSLLGALTSETYSDPTQHLEREQALAKQFAEILHFTLRFDELKVWLFISLSVKF